MVLPRQLCAAVMVGLMVLTLLVDAREGVCTFSVPKESPGIVRIEGKPMVFCDGMGDMDDNVHFNAEAHQHPWLATFISMSILIFLIFGIIHYSNNMGGGDDDA